MIAPTTCRWCPRLTTRTAGVCYYCERDGNGQTDATYALIDGDWRFDPFKRVQVWVAHPPVIRQCPQADCTRVVGPRCAMCEACALKARRARAQGDAA